MAAEHIALGSENHGTSPGAAVSAKAPGHKVPGTRKGPPSAGPVPCGTALVGNHGWLGGGTVCPFGLFRLLANPSRRNFCYHRHTFVASVRAGRSLVLAGKPRCQAGSVGVIPAQAVQRPWLASQGSSRSRPSARCGLARAAVFQGQSRLSPEFPGAFSFISARLWGGRGRIHGRRPGCKASPRWGLPTLPHLFLGSALRR